MPPFRFPVPLFAALALCASASRAAQITSAEIARPEGLRHYLLATPEQAQSGKRALVIVLHGHGGSASLLTGRNHINSAMRVWLEVADREQVLVLAPDGAKGSDDKRGWNDCRADATTNPHTDDVGLIGALIDKAVAEHQADPARVYVIGTSNGGAMAYRLATEIGARLAGIAAISALWPANSLCPMPSRPLPVLIVHGTADKVVPYAGGEVGHFLLRGRGSAISAPAALELWRNLAKLAGAPVETTFAHRDAGDATRAHRSVWGADPAGMQLEFIRIENGGHTEPSIRHRLHWMYVALVGAQNGDVETVEEAWRFFKDKRAAAPL
jgi:polyhydroxybutyrate depolymerase